MLAASVSTERPFAVGDRPEALAGRHDVGEATCSSESMRIGGDPGRGQRRGALGLGRVSGSSPPRIPSASSEMPVIGGDGAGREVVGRGDRPQGLAGQHRVRRGCPRLWPPTRSPRADEPRCRSCSARAPRRPAPRLRVVGVRRPHPETVVTCLPRSFVPAYACESWARVAATLHARAGGPLCGRGGPPPLKEVVQGGANIAGALEMPALQLPQARFSPRSPGLFSSAPTLSLGRYRQRGAT